MLRKEILEIMRERLVRFDERTAEDEKALCELNKKRENLQGKEEGRKIRTLCANYDVGNRLLLDDSESHVGSQTISYSLVCSVFTEIFFEPHRYQICPISMRRFWWTIFILKQTDFFLTA